jgi:hypothetical protein
MVLLTFLVLFVLPSLALHAHLLLLTVAGLHIAGGGTLVSGAGNLFLFLLSLFIALVAGVKPLSGLEVVLAGGVEARDLPL